MTAQLKILQNRSWPSQKKLCVKENEEIDWEQVDSILSMNQEPRSIQTTLCMLSEAKEIAFLQKKHKNLAGITKLLNHGDEAYLYKHLIKNVFSAKTWPGLATEDI